MNARKITISSVQVHAHEREAFDSVWPRICEQIRRAAGDGSQLIVLPEGTVPAYVIGNLAVDSSVTERALGDIRALARDTKTVIVYGSVRHEADVQFNSAFVVDADGEVAGTADKSFLWHFDRRWFARGEVRAPIATSLGKLGVMICADGRIPTIARSLVDDGAELLVMPTAWVTSGRNPQDFENIQADLLAAVRARENGVPFVAANKTGVERGCVAYCGKSQIVDASGEIVALASQLQAQTIRAQIVMGNPHPSRARSRAQAEPSGVPAENLRIAITPQEHGPGRELLCILEADLALTGTSAGDAAALERAAAIVVDDAQIADPGGLVDARLGGRTLAVWRTQSTDEGWQRRLVRARAVELRMFVVCIRPGAYAFAADPDGVIVCGTFEDFHTATFAFAPGRAQQTLVAPGTDVIEGLEHARRADVGF